MKSIRKASELAEAEFIHREEIKSIEKVAERFSVALTPHVIDLLQKSNEKDKEAIRKQFIPSAEELIQTPVESKDPIGDSVYTKTKGLIHRYPDRCLLMPLNACPVYCRFCFRRETVGAKNKMLSKAELQVAFNYITAHTEIWEVILTGGDPFMLNPKMLSHILLELEKIEHVAVVRIHTRIPIVDPKRINDEMLSALKINKALYVALHTNHPAEFTDLVKKTCARLVDSGIPMLSQTVLLKGVNDDPEIMGELMRTLVKNRIKPYYLHHGELAEGTSHFRTTIEEGQKIMKFLRGRYSGLCQPTYVLDIPGGAGKAPIGCQYIHLNITNHSDREAYTIEDWQGNLHNYIP